MRSRTTVASLAMACVLGHATASLAQQKREDNKAPEGFVALFNGNDLDGW